ncbi:MAG: helix-turn-helix domain-containing protein [Ruminococcaceae bacterium]|nr:helix-turn-helix domain-containing protein [Oscillospiraceae bacterium]
MSEIEKTLLPGSDPELIKQAVNDYSLACGTACRFIDNLGATVFISREPQEQLSVCEFAGKVLPGAPTESTSEISCTKACENAHLYGCYQSERFGGRYIYFCPIGLTHWASPIMQEGTVIGALVGGPVHLVDPEEFLIEEMAAKNGIHQSNLPRLRQEMAVLPVVATERVNSMSEILFLTARGLSDHTFSELDIRKGSTDLQARLWEQVSFMKNYSYASDDILAYPIEKEQRLLELIETGNKTGTQELLNEILGHIFFSSSGTIEVMRARVIELVVLLSRAAIRGGADVEQIFGLNYMYLNKISSFRNIDEIAYWLSGILGRFTDQVFNLTNVKHADVIYRAIDHVRKNYMKKITLEDTAARVFLSPAYFSRIFKEEMKENFNSYVNSVRVDAARRLLLKENIPLVEISTMVGFEGQSYFSKVFKKNVGVTPGRYRESRGNAPAQHK